MQNEEELKQLRDDIRCETTVQTLVDVLRRFEETSEGSYSLYDVIGYMVEDLVRDGCCAACVNETLLAVYKDVGVDPTLHIMDESTVH